jgi:uncharacterized protein (TIGR02996 family)
MQDAFVRDVAANPEDDAPRLIFADWLEDNGDPDRAEFVRLQCRQCPSLTLVSDRLPAAGSVEAAGGRA